LEQALVNLIDNAVKFSPANSTVRVEAQETGAEIVIRVMDQGDGIPPEHLDRIFERFYRVDAGRSRKVGGTGLGLAIVKHIAQAHRGRVTVSSTPGEGSTFSIMIPQG
jgi:two-component system phosphate regulon sensor histidine kinase PhoR